MTVKLALFEKMENANYAQQLQKDGLKAAAGKGEVKYVAVKNYKVGSKQVNLFLVVDKPTDFLNLIKKQGSTVVTSTGVAEVEKDTHGRHTIVVKSAVGGLSTTIISGIIKPAVGNDANFEGTTPERQKAEQEHQVHAETATARKPAIMIAKESHEQARAEGKLDWTFDPTPEVVEQMSKVSLETGEYKKFADSFAKLADKYHFDDYKKVPVNIWSDMLKGLSKSGYIKGKIPFDGQPDRFILAYKGPAGEVLREKMLADAMEGLSKYTEHASKYLDKVITEVNKGGSGKTWAFWSGTGAQAAARKEASDGVVLEGSVGSWFDDVWDFEPFTGVANLALWAAMSELYAKKAAENYNKFRFVGFLGPGATREQSVFNKIEQPTFVEVLNVKKTVTPTIRWFVVECAKDKDGRWQGTGNPSKAAASRAAALSEIQTIYGG